jgi:LPXTG-motif cell wall-anchored protein
MLRLRIFTATLAVAGLLTAGLALGQNADKNTAAPTKNDYRLRVVEPVEGARLVGSSFQVVVDLRPNAEVGGEQKNSDSMPAPRVDVFLDNENKGTLQQGQNVVTVDAVTPGAHKLVVLAKNLSGEVIDRKEINFTAEAGTAVAQSSVETHRAPAASAPAPAPAPPRVESAPPPPAPVAQAPAPAPAPMTSTRETMTRDTMTQRETLPETASSTPLLAVAGLGLLVTGLALRRRA